MTTYSIKSTATNVGPSSIEEESISIETYIRFCNYTRDGEPKEIEFPRPNPAAFVPTADVTEEMIVGWIKQYETT